jgi:glutathione peroxidase
MKLYLILAYVFTTAFSLNGFYDLEINASDGSLIKLSKYQGKKIVIGEFNAASPDGAQLRFLDSLQKANKNNLIVMAVPALDFGTMNTESDKAMTKFSNLSIIITQPVKVKKEAKADQHPLFRWLTNSNDNKHFNNDVFEEGLFFIVDEKGNMRGTLGKKSPVQAWGKVLN